MKHATISKFAAISSLMLLGLTTATSNAAIAVPKHDIAAGKKIAETVCGACHGVDGVSTVPAQPNLGGQNIKYLYKQLSDFKSGARVNPIMSVQVAPLTDQDLANVAAYYSSQKRWSVGYANPALVTAGQKTFYGGDSKRGVIPCAGCHGGKGNGNDYAAFPRISGQHSAYLATQLKLFRAAGREDDVLGKDQVRANDGAKKGDKGMMQTVASHLSDNDIKALSDYISALH